MLVFVCLEASQPSGVNYRVAVGCLVHPRLASLVLSLMRLF